MRLIAVLPFVALTFFCWGNYGPLMHHGQAGMGNSSLRPFIGVGLAYFLIAVVVPVLMLKSKGEKGHWTVSGLIWSLIAGAVGAIGALGIIMAFKFRGNPIYVMPLVFGGAPVVNTFVTMWMAKSYKEAKPIFFAGVLIVAVGAAGVLIFKPAKAKDAEETMVMEPGEDGSYFFTYSDKTTKKVTNLEELRTDEAYAEEYKHYRKVADLTGTELLLIPLSIVLTALCWGCYGPTLHKGQMKMAGSRLRPFLCVGVAYFAIAVVVPFIALSAFGEGGDWSFGGMVWSLAAGAAGAVGALGIIMAFNFGGKPIFVMPLVFGGAPVINTFTSILEQGTASQVGPVFLGSLALVITGAVMVLVFAPKPGHLPKPGKPVGAADARDEDEEPPLRDPVKAAREENKEREREAALAEAENEEPAAES